MTSSAELRGHRIEANRQRAVKGWIADPPPDTPKSLPPAHIHTWARINGATCLIDE